MLKFKWETEFRETEIGQIPEDWEIKKLGEFVQKAKNGSTPPTKDKSYWNGEIPWITSNHLRSLYVFKGDRYVTKKAINEKKTSIANKGALLFGTRIGIGNVAIAGRELAFNQDVTAIWLKEGIKGEYLVRLIRSKFYQQFLKDIAEGTTVGGIDRETLLNLPIVYPPPPEQSRIATVLSWFDDWIENKKRQNEILEKVVMAIFKSWFVDFEPFKDEEFVYNEELGKEIPKGWEVKPIGEVAEFTNGLSYKGSEKFDYYLDDSFVFITLNNIKEGGGFKTEFAWIKSDRLKERHFVKEGDLIFANTEQTKSGRLLATPAFIVFPDDYNKDRGVYSHHITKVSPNIPCIKPLLYLMFRYYQENIAQTYHTGTGVWGFDLKNFKENFFTLLPPQPILQHFHFLVEPLFQKIILNQKQIMVLRKIRDALLPRLVFGKLRVEVI